VDGRALDFRVMFHGEHFVLTIHRMLLKIKSVPKWEVWGGPGRSIHFGAMAGSHFWQKRREMGHPVQAVMPDSATPESLRSSSLRETAEQ
jgi:hypothetical protein